MDKMNTNHKTENTVQELDIITKSTWHRRLVMLFTRDLWQLVIVTFWFEGHIVIIAPEVSVLASKSRSGINNLCLVTRPIA